MPNGKSIASQVAKIRNVLPTSLGSAELRGALAEDIRARAVFSARVTSADYLSKVSEVVEAMAAGEMDRATARVTLLETLRSIGYTPEGGFPDAESGSVPPALAGTLQDISSFQRQELMLTTQLALVRGRGQQLRGSSADRLKVAPAWELVRYAEKAAPRDWPSRWIIAGGKLSPGGRMIALKGDPIWGELGASGNFDDALDVDFPPFAFNSGMGWREVDVDVVSELGITGPDGEIADEWLSQKHPLTVDSQSGIPAPQASVKTMAPPMLEQLQKDGITIVEGTATPSDRVAELEARMKTRMERALARRDAIYKSRE